MTVKFFVFDRQALIKEAYLRVASKREVMCAVEQGGSVKSEVEHCLIKAHQCVESLAKPAGAMLEVSAEVVDEGVLLEQGPVIHNTRMRDQLTQGAKVRPLLNLFGNETLGVSTNDAGFFSPMHSLVGVMMGIPGQREP